MANKSLIVVSLSTGEKVSIKSIPSNCMLPLATSLALCLSIVPSELNLIFKIHLHPIGFFPLRRLVKC